jgi:hypothetical protein
MSVVRLNYYPTLQNKEKISYPLLEEMLDASGTDLRC